MRIKQKITHLVESTRNVFHWLPVIWKDNDWDYCYLEEILLFKLKNMEKFFKSDKTHVADAKEIAEEIPEVVALLERIREENYIPLVDPDFDNWINQSCTFLSTKNENGTFHKEFITPEWTEEERKHRQEIYNKAENMNQADLAKAFGLIAKNIRKWWD